MANRTMEIALRATGGDAATGVINQFAAAVRQAGGDVRGVLISALGEIQSRAQQAGSASAAAVRSIGAEVSDSETKVDDLSRSVERLDDAAKAAGQNSGVADVGKDAADSGFQVDALREKFEKLQAIGQTLSGISSFSFGITADAIQNANEGAGVMERQKSLLKQQGRSGDLDTIEDAVQDVTVRGNYDDDDSIREAAVRAESFSVSTEHMGEMLELAARQARTMRGAAGDVGAVAEQMSKVYNTGKNISMLQKSGVTIDDADIERMNQAYAISKEAGQAEFMKTMGDAIRSNSVALEDSLSSAEVAANRLKRAEDDAMTSFGTGAGNVQAGINSAKASMLELVNKFPALEQGAGYFTLLGGYAAGAVGGVVSIIGQIGSLILALNAMGITSVASFGTVATAAWTAFTTWAAGAWAAAGATLAAMAPVLVVLAEIAAVALIAAAAIWAADKAWHAKEDAENAANIEDGKEADRKYYEMDKKRGKTTDDFDTWLKKRGDPDEDYNKEHGGDSGDAPDLGKMQKQLDAIQSGTKSGPQMPPGGTPALPQMPAMPSVLTGAALTSAVSMGGAPADSYQSQIDDLSDRIRAETNAVRKKVLQDQLIALRRAQRDAKASEKAANAAERAADKKQSLDEKDARLLDKTDSDIKYNDQIEALEAQLDDAKEEANAARVSALTLQIARLKARKEYDDKLIAARDEDDAGHRSALELVAKKQLDADMRHAESEARRAGDSTTKTKGSTKGKDDAQAHDTFLRSLIGGGSGLGNSVAAFAAANALNPNANVGDRFAGMALSRWQPDLSQPAMTGAGMGQSDSAGSSSNTSRSGNRVATYEGSSNGKFKWSVEMELDQNDAREVLGLNTRGRRSRNGG